MQSIIIFYLDKLLYVLDIMIVTLLSSVFLGSMGGGVVLLFHTDLFAGQSSTVITMRSANDLVLVLALSVGAKSSYKRKLASS